MIQSLTVDDGRSSIGVSAISSVGRNGSNVSVSDGRGCGVSEAAVGERSGSVDGRVGVRCGESHGHEGEDGEQLERFFLEFCFDFQRCTYNLEHGDLSSALRVEEDE